LVAVEIDDHLCELLRQRLGGNAALTVLNRDVLSGKHEIAPEVIDALKPLSPMQLVSNLPYNVAVPFLMNCLELSWRGVAGGELRGRPILFEGLTFTVQRELAQRLVASVDDDAYGPVSVIVALLARATPGRILPAEAFWPRPKVQSQMVRLDFSPEKARRLKDFDTLSAVLSATFGHRRKKIGSATKHRDCPFSAERFAEGLRAAGIDADLRPEQVPPEAFGALANAL
jgi:16S rRNA (adenine1518-N6/adenine1519-N6)-dimethyltransferase